SYRDLLAGRPIIVADLSEYEEAAALFPPDTAPPSSLLVAPMVVGEKVIGAMWLQSDHLHAYGEEDGDLLMGIAALVGMALHNAELYGSVQDELEKRKAAEEALQERVRQLRSLNVASQSLTESLDVNEVLHRIALQARDILDAYGCTLYLLDEDGATLRPVVAIEPGVEEQILNTPVPVDGSLTGKAVRQRRSLIFNDVLSEQNAYYIPDTPVYDNERILVAPLIVENRVVGVLNMDRLGDAFEQEDLALAEAFAIYAATALRNAQAFTRLQHEVEERNRAEEALRESEERYRSIFELSPFAIWIADQDGTITFANEAMAELYGLRGPRDIIGKYNIRQILPDIFQPYMELFRQGRRQAVAPFEHSLDLGLLPIPSRRDETVHVRTTLFPVPTGIDRRPNLVVVQEDISERVRAQQELQTLNRLHTVLSKSGQAIVRLKEPRALLQATCRIAVEDGGFRMAWVGVLNPQSKKVEIGAYAGEVGDYLDKLTIDLSHPSYGQGPTGKAMRSGRMYVCNDIEHDPEMAPWRQDALRLGYRASVSLPLFVADEVWGSLNLYAGVPGFFDAVELSLLQELASNLSFALDAADQQVARERAERALLKGMRQQQSLIKAVHHLAESLDLDQVLHRIGQLAKDILDAYGCTVYLLDEDGQTLRPVVALEPEGQDQIMATPIQVDASLTGRAVQERRTLIFNDLSREDTVFYVPGTPMYELERILVVPLIFEDKLFGAMNLNRLGPVFDERDQMLAEAFAIYAATALHNASTYHDLQSEMEQRRQAEEALRTSLREKEVLLQELYHRTKNNMQVISAMLSLEEARVEDPTVSEVFREVQNRIRVMALVHQKLYQSKDLSRIDLSEYVQDLCRLLMQSYNVSPDRIKLKLNVQDTQVLMDIAIPCGLILNELISNAFKYAFPNNAEGEIQVTLKRSPEGDIELVVSDNGVGVPPDFDFRQSDTLGLYTVFAIVEHQLQGEIDFESDHGLTCRIRFNEQIYFERV
ncbi:MAG: GAF domain-containing protein, partial [Caldilineae bacterium]